MISIKNLHKFFNKGRQNELHVLNGISLDLPERGMVAIFGRSGCGKTTLLNVIGGLDGFAEGTLTIEGKSIGENTDVIRNRYIGYIFQNYNLNASESCFDNVADALRLCGMTDEEEIRERVTAALRGVGMENYARRTPDTLSGGQQQRIAIARAIVKNPRIILADEPTGNLDEANTVMIMDLLRAIANDHLVLLVTHEASLVDHYCDTVIELSDGQVAGTRHNLSTGGYTAKSKNDIYLGELERREIADENAVIEYYGEKPETPVRLRIVNKDGRLYVEVGTEKVCILDRTSEVKLREGVYEEKPRSGESESIDMSSLPPVEGTRFGRLFSLRSSIRSGYSENFKKRTRGKGVLRGCMCLFAAVVVFISSLFGTAFRDVIDARGAYNHNVFYLHTPDADTSARLNAAIGDPDTGIDYIHLNGYYQGGDTQVYFRTGSFETFEQHYGVGSFGTNAVILDASLSEGMKLLAGKRDDLGIDKILITTKVADALIEKSSLGYITEYKDLIGLVSSNISVEGKSSRIAGIVEGDEPAVYMSELAMAKYLRSSGLSLSYTSLGSDYGIEVAPGEAVLVLRNSDGEKELPRVGETIKIQGRDVKVTAILRPYHDYSEWLTANGIKKLESYDYFRLLLEEERPELDEESEEFKAAFDELMNERYFEYYDYYYSECEAFYRDYYLFSDYIELWLYVEKGVEVAKFAFLPEEYYKAWAFKQLYGRYPTNGELFGEGGLYESLPYLHEELKNEIVKYENEYYRRPYQPHFPYMTYMVSAEDYVAFSKQLGETHPSASVYYEYYEAVPYGAAAVEKEIIDVDVSVNTSMYSGLFTVIHSSDPDKTAAWLAAEFSDLPDSGDYRVGSLVTPDDIFDELIRDKTEEIITSLVTMAVMLVLMSLCMYFIMRSSLMNRIKEVGIYRAIGVSRRNLVFKFFVEAVVLTVLTVFIGYALSSAFIFVCVGSSTLVSQVFYYPAWLAGADLAVLFLVSLLFGTLPITALLRKTPSEILAKYDI